MSKMSKKEMDKLKAQMIKPERCQTWVGTRPAVFKNKKAYNRKEKHKSSYND